MSKLRKKIAVILILALTFNTNATWTFAESSEVFSNLEEVSKEEKSTQYVEESLAVETSEMSVTVAEDDDNEDSGDNNMVVGWKMINNEWHFFGAEGIMFKSAITPDGYLVDGDGKWMK